MVDITNKNYNITIKQQLLTLLLDTKTAVLVRRLDLRYDRRRDNYGVNNRGAY